MCLDIFKNKCPKIPKRIAGGLLDYMKILHDWSISFWSVLLSLSPVLFIFSHLLFRSINLTSKYQTWHMLFITILHSIFWQIIMFSYGTFVFLGGGILTLSVQLSIYIKTPLIFFYCVYLMISKVQEQIAQRKHNTEIVIIFYIKFLRNLLPILYIAWYEYTAP